MLELRQQEDAVKLVDALDAGKYLRNDVVGKEMLIVIAVQQLIVKHLHLHHQNSTQMTHTHTHTHTHTQTEPSNLV